MNPDDRSPTLDEERRRFLERGLAAAPLLVTLTARPADAGLFGGSLGAYDYNGGEPLDDEPVLDDDPPTRGKGSGGGRRGRG